MRKIASFILLLLFCFSVKAQEVLKTQWHSDTESIDAIIKATYEVISGPAGQRDWDRFRNLFDAKAQMGAVYKNKNGVEVFKSFTPEEYIKNNNDFLLKNAFIENEIHRTTNQLNYLVQVFSTYKYTTDGKTQRGINSIQLIKQNNRWYIFSLIWEEENEFNIIPKIYLQVK
ncbi:MAG: hypothetical protein V4667_07170 [Bacteroidota bacterium]